MPSQDTKNQYSTFNMLIVPEAIVGNDVIANTSSFNILEFPGVELNFNFIANSLDSNVGTQDLNIKSFTLEQSDDAGFAVSEPVPSDRIIGDLSAMAVDMTGLQIIYSAGIGLKDTKQYVRGQFIYDFSDAVNPPPFFYMTALRYPVYTAAP